MSNAIYTAVSGAIANMDHLEVVANSLAQANTTGFKGDLISFEQVRVLAPGQTAEVDDLQDTAFVRARATTVDSTQGEMIRTSNSLDIALTGNGFLRIDTDQGERLTRDGRLMVNRDGLVMTTSGHKVLNDMGSEVFLPPDQKPTFEMDGTIRAGSQVIGRLGIQAVAPGTKLTKDSAGNIKVPAEARNASLNGSFGVHQGHLENSNVKPVDMMVKMVSVQRNFEALNQVIQTYSRMDTAANRLVR